MIRTRRKIEEPVVVELLNTRTLPLETDYCLDETVPWKEQKGRFQDRMLEEIRNLAQFGLTNEQIATFYGIQSSTFNRYMLLSKELSTALYHGRDLNGQELVASLYKQAIGYEVEERAIEYEMRKDKLTGEDVKFLKSEKIMTRHIQPNVNAATYLLRVRFPALWAESVKSQTTQNVNIQVNNKFDMSDMSMEELQLMKKIGIKSLPTVFAEQQKSA